MSLAKWPKITVKTRDKKMKKPMEALLAWVAKNGLEKEYPYNEAVMDYICYGQLDEARMRRALDKLVKPSSTKREVGR